MMQHYGDSVSKPDPALYWQDLEAMMTNLCVGGGDATCGVKD